MPLERLLQILMASLASLATLMLGMGQSNPVLPVLAMVVAASSVYFTDIKGWIRLNTPVANLAGLAAVVASLADYSSVTQERQLLALANLLIYLQCVLFYRPKSARIYWMLALLSLLQVAVATVLNLSVWFGMLLIIYLFLALTTLSLFLIYREQSRFAEMAQSAISSKPGSQADAAPRRRLSSQRTEFTARNQRLVLSGGVPRSLSRLVLRMGIYTLGLTTFLFIIVPRTRGLNWGDQAGAVQHTVGFAEQVSLGEMGEIIEDPAEVLQIRFFDNDTGSPYTLTEIPLIRGSILSTYHAGAWHDRKFYEEEGELPRPESRRGLVRQEVQVGKLDTSTLFGVYPLLRYKRSPKLVYYPRSERLVRGQGVYRFPLQYEMLTSGLQRGRQVDIIPASRFPVYEDQLLQLPAGEDRLDRLKDLAKDVVSRREEQDPVSRARLLNHYLRDSGVYRYSLSPPARNPELDPIEDFLTSNRLGHCEYFASALVLMARSVGIPARMVVGFKGADWNPLSGYYHVRQLHAHTWVEIYLRPDEIPSEALNRNQSGDGSDATSPWRHGAWLRLDPTPAVSGDGAPHSESSIPTFKQVLDYANHLWSNYVLSMDSRRQRERVFNPIKDASQGVATVLLDRNLWRKTFHNLGKILRGERIDDGGMWFNWRAGLLTILALLMALGLYRLALWIMRRWLHLGEQRTEKSLATGVAEAEFYRRLEAILAREHVVRSATQTQREFAHHAHEHLARQAETQDVATLPRRITDAYYQVRFGNLPLDQRETAAVEQALDELAARLTVDGGGDAHAGNGHGSHSPASASHP